MIKRTATVLALAGVALFVAHSTAQGSANLPPPARAYLCFEGHSAADITDKANAAGARGWPWSAPCPTGMAQLVL